MATLTTPLVGLPYPDGAERVMDGDNAIGALANALDQKIYRQVLPAGVIVSGASFVPTVATQQIPLDTVVRGLPAFFLNATDLISIPVGLDGLYSIFAFGSATFGTTAPFVRVSIRVGATTLAGTQPYIIGGATAWWTLALTEYVAAGTSVSLWQDCGSGNWPTIVPIRFGVVRLGDNFAGTTGLLRDQIEALPAPEEVAP